MNILFLSSYKQIVLKRVRRIRMVQTRNIQQHLILSIWTKTTCYQALSSIVWRKVCFFAIFHALPCCSCLLFETGSNPQSFNKSFVCQHCLPELPTAIRCFEREQDKIQLLRETWNSYIFILLILVLIRRRDYNWT